MVNAAKDAEIEGLKTEIENLRARLIVSEANERVALLEGKAMHRDVVRLEKEKNARGKQD